MCYTCELTVNGVNYGVKAMSPYKYKIPIDKLKQKDNVIELRVTNTMANANFYAKVFNAWDISSISSYHYLQKEFDKDSFESGLYKPITVTFENI